jgi:hypothetical protein
MHLFNFFYTGYEQWDFKDLGRKAVAKAEKQRISAVMLY